MGLDGNVGGCLAESVGRLFWNPLKQNGEKGVDTSKKRW